MGRPFPTKALIFANLGVLCAAAWGFAEPGIIAVTIIALVFVDGVVILKWQYAKSATSNQKRETSKFSSTVQKLLVANLISTGLTGFLYLQNFPIGEVKLFAIIFFALANASALGFISS
jgi:hypothetical protein